MQYWFFGFPGSGKSHVAGLFSRMTGIPVCDGDDFHTEDDRRAVAQGTFGLGHRHAQLGRINAAIQAMRTPDVLVTHPLPDKASRTLVRELSGRAVRLVHVNAPLVLIKARLSVRTDHHFGPDLLDAWIPQHWEKPAGEDCFVIENGVSDMLEPQLRQMRALDE